MRAAFLVGVSIYDSLEPLPACEKDVAIIESLLEATGSYEKIKAIKENTTSDRIKTEFRKFAKELTDQSVDELFIYFSGHGFQEEGEMFLCCSNYSISKSASTSLLNSEVDELIRTITPALTVKIIDACQSGYQYIKDVDTLSQKLIQRTGIDKFIFMASSQQQESSFADHSISLFTKAFFDAVVNKDMNEDIYYRDIQSYIADAFRDYRQQTPLFVSQSTGLEIFARSNDAIKLLRADYKNLIQQRTKEKSLATRVLEAVDKMESYYVPKERVDALLQTLAPSNLQLSLTDEVSRSLYKITNCSSISLESIGSEKVIAQEVASKKWNTECFVSITRESYKVRQLRNDLATLIAGGLFSGGIGGKKLDDSHYEVVVKERPVSICVNYEVPFDCLCLEIESLRLSLPPWNSYLFIIPARTYSVLALGFARFNRSSWDEFNLVPSDIEWLFHELAWRDWDARSPIHILIEQTEKRLRQDVFQLTGLIDDETEISKQISSNSDLNS